MHSIAVFLLRRMCASGKAHREGDEGLSSDKDTENIIRYFNLSLVNYNCYIFTGKINPLMREKIFPEKLLSLGGFVTKFTQ